jgi:glycosyltransferase involved in cell wall biosynthesis
MSSDRPPLSVLCVVVAPEPVPGPRYRVLQYLPALAHEGLQSKVLAIQSAASARRSVTSGGMSSWRRLWHWLRIAVETHIGCLRVVLTMGSYDRVLVYRVPLPQWATWFLRPHRHRLVYDFDDALDAGEGTSVVDRWRRRHLAATLRRAVSVCATVVTSNCRNADTVRALGGVPVVIPTSLVLARYPARLHAPSQALAPVVIGWMGTPSTARYLVDIEEALAEVVARRPGTRIRLVGSGGNPFRSIQPELVAWSDGTEVEELLGFDIGLMPMPDTAWTRGKAALKALQYGAASAPTVASWTSTNEEILADGGGTCLCRSREEWIEALVALIDDPVLRSEMGRRARVHVGAQYSVEVNAARLAAVIRAPVAEPT